MPHTRAAAGCRSARRGCNCSLGRCNCRPDWCRRTPAAPRAAPSTAARPTASLRLARSGAGADRASSAASRLRINMVRIFVGALPKALTMGTPPPPHHTPPPRLLPRLPPSRFHAPAHPVPPAPAQSASCGGARGDRSHLGSRGFPLRRAMCRQPPLPSPLPSLARPRVVLADKTVCERTLRTNPLCAPAASGRLH